MLVQDIMKTEVITIPPSASIRMALIHSQQNRIRHLPVVEEGNLVGIVTDRDLREAGPTTLEQDRDTRILDQPVASIMTKEVITAHPRDFVEDAALTLYEHNIGCLPIMRHNKVVGILTGKDILHTLVELMGVNQPSQHIEVAVPDRPGTLADVADVFRQHHVNVGSVLVYPGHEPQTKHLVFRVQAIDAHPLIEQLADQGFHVVWPTPEPDDWD